MGFVKAFSGALSGSLADQWKDFLTIPPHLPETAGFAPAQQSRANISRSSNTKGSRNIITNGSKILVPEGFALVTLENGAITGFVSERSDSVNSQSFLAGNGLADGLFKQSWDRFKFGGIPGTSQLGFYVNLKELPNNRFGTQGAIYWDDAYLRTQAGAIAHGTYSLRITDPLLFIKSFLPADYYMGSGAIFDFAAMGNAAANQLFTEVVGSLAAAFAAYANEPGKHNRIANLQRDTLGFSQSLSQVVEDNFHWKCDRGLSIERAALISIQYDETTESLIHRCRKKHERHDGYGKQRKAILRNFRNIENCHDDRRDNLQDEVRLPKERRYHMTQSHRLEEGKQERCEYGNELPVSPRKAAMQRIEHLDLKPDNDRIQPTIGRLTARAQQQVDRHILRSSFLWPIVGKSRPAN